MFFMAAMCEDECDKCQSSIDHMYEKIDAQGCNPNTMQKAWDQIREDCDHFDSAVGLMAETCSFGSTARPGCNLPGINLKDHNISIKLIDGFYSTRESNADYFNANIVINIHNQSFVFEVNDFEGEELLFQPEDLVVHEGDVIEVVLENINHLEDGTANEIARNSVNFTFSRNGNWHRQREIYFESSRIVPRLDFRNW